MLALVVKNLSQLPRYLTSSPVGCGMRALLGHSPFWGTSWAPCSTPSVAELLPTSETLFYLLR